MFIAAWSSEKSLSASALCLTAHTRRSGVGQGVYTAPTDHDLNDLDDLDHLQSTLYLTFSDVVQGLYLEPWKHLLDHAHRARPCRSYSSHPVTAINRPHRSFLKDLDDQAGIGVICPTCACL